MKKGKKKSRFVCGTPAGYIKHLRKSERPCRHCLTGSETYSRDEIIDLINDFQKWNNEQRLWKTYKLSHDRFEQIFTAQGRQCACCLSPNPGKSPWCIDHDHQTGLIRGILCADCNTGIEQLGDSLQGLQQAVIYLQAHQARGGYERAKRGPKPQPPLPKISTTMRQCFDLFKQGAPCSKVVSSLKLTPAAATEIYELWITRGGTPTSKHFFQVPKEPPQRIMCACGYSVEWHNSNEMNTAVSLVNAHIKEADSQTALGV